MQENIEGEYNIDWITFSQQFIVQGGSLAWVSDICGVKSGGWYITDKEMIRMVNVLINTNCHN